MVASTNAQPRALNPLFANMQELFEPLRSQGSKALEFGGVPVRPGALAAYRHIGLMT